MILPTKSRYSVPEAAFHIAMATGESVSSNHILDWGAQGFFKLYLPMTDAQIRQGTEILSLHGVQVEIRPTVDEAAQLANRQRIRIANCWYNGQKSQFVRRKNAEYGGGYVPDDFYFSIKSVCVRGDELDVFTLSIKSSAEEVTRTAQQSAASLPCQQPEKSWQEKVREIADELDARDASAGAEASKQNMAARVARIAEQRGIRGPHGKLTEGNILREALQGRRWSRAARTLNVNGVDDKVRKSGK